MDSEKQQLDIMKCVLWSILFTIAGLFAAVTVSTALVRATARTTLLSILRAAAFGFAYVMIGILYVPILLLGQLDKRSEGASAVDVRLTPIHHQVRVYRRRRNNSDVSDLDIGSPRFLGLERPAIDDTRSSVV
jgi:hypothetical protein